MKMLATISLIGLMTNVAFAQETPLVSAVKGENVDYYLLNREKVIRPMVKMKMKMGIVDMGSSAPRDRRYVVDVDGRLSNEFLTERGQSLRASLPEYKLGELVPFRISSVKVDFGNGVTIDLGAGTADQTYFASEYILDSKNGAKAVKAIAAGRTPTFVITADTKVPKVVEGEPIMLPLAKICPKSTTKTARRFLVEIYSNLRPYLAKAEDDESRDRVIARALDGCLGSVSLDQAPSAQAFLSARVRAVENAPDVEVKTEKVGEEEQTTYLRNEVEVGVTK